ncbi:MAG: hypothetical protein SGI71_07740 [Verrucomicrobiota bacterium]|nr:hypothetical protein [Verrucomicrobiota bacterium]
MFPDFSSDTNPELWEAPLGDFEYPRVQTLAHETQTRSFRVPHAGGMKACSRWLSEVRATPPDHQINMNRTPAGVPAISGYAHRHTRACISI